MERYICIHGHFYQPPRENPWLEAIELQDSAYPYHDWNERITAECYAPNAVSRILDDRGQIVRIVNNYSRISFNFGPTLMAWLEDQAPEVYRAVLDADLQSQARFSGHGSALAQPFNHMIMPLANGRDKHTQVLWGLYDFEHRFRRRAEGMWLPETAMDINTLEVLAEVGIQFTILSPYQAARVRRLGEKEWKDAADGQIDPTMAYILHLPSGRAIHLFFYDAPVSRGVAFERLLANGEEFARRLLGAFSAERPHPQLVHIATDGESYGHHFIHGEMGLAYALHHIESKGLARLTNYGEFLQLNPPTHEVEILENTSWSCAHGLERWRSDCGCHTGAHSGWRQSWRRPLREALDWLRDSLAPSYLGKARKFLRSPWQARDEYISVVLDRSDRNIQAFLDRHARHKVGASEKITILKLLELQRHAMLMYTSCGWFFDDISGIETVQIIQYAGRALQLAEELFGDAREAHFLSLLERAPSNLPEHRDGRRIYEKFVLPAKIKLENLAAHYGINSLFEEYPERGSVYSYDVRREDYQTFEIRPARLAIGRARFTSRITHESSVLSFGVLFLGDHNLNGGVRKFRGADSYNESVRELSSAFSLTDIPQAIRLLDKHFGESPYSIRSLFRDEQRRVLKQILSSSLEQAEAEYRQIYERRAPLMRFLSDLRMPLPKGFLAAAEFTINSALRREMADEEPDLRVIQSLLDEAADTGITLDRTTLEYTFRGHIERSMKSLFGNPSNLSALAAAESAVRFAGSLPFRINLWTAQNIYYQMLKGAYRSFEERAEKGDAAARRWVDSFDSLGKRLGISVTGIKLPEKQALAE